MAILLLLGIFFLDGTLGQMRSTWPSDLHPGEDCLTYDGSKVPDCRLFIDPEIKEPYYHPHNTNCSRFWECGPDYEACLFECAPCGKDNPMCNDQWALTFDPAYQFPVGPVCDWPSNIDCTNTPGDCDCLDWQTCVGGKCIPQCEEDKDCPAGYECSDCKWCESLSECSQDSECKHAMCDPPANPHTTCEYCDASSAGCVPGCPDDSLCPANYPICGHGGGAHLCGCNADRDCAADQLCNVNTHECFPKPIDVGCDNDNANCPSQMCDEPNDPYHTCTWCDDTVCKPGCPDNSKCPANRPICGANGQPHRCGCNVDADCADGDKCGNNECYPPECSENGDCTPNDLCDIINTPEYLDCQYCENENCVPGCIDDSHCPPGYECSAHICTPNDGKALVKSIKIYSKSDSCTGCTTDDEGLELTLNGRQDVVYKVQCTTKNLDHNSEVDYDEGSAVFDDKFTLGTFKPDGGCLNAPLDGAVTDSLWKWTGEGDWVGDKICIEWSGSDVFASVCSFVAGGKITACDKADSPVCP